MKLVDTDETIVLVIGNTAAATVRDRLLALELKAEIDARGSGHPYRRAFVVNDEWYLEHPVLHHNPTIALGGPGANGVAREFSQMLPTLYNLEERVFVQADFEGEPKRAAVWGADADCTAAAVEVFRGQGFLADLLERIWRFRLGVVV